MGNFINDLIKSSNALRRVEFNTLYIDNVCYVYVNYRFERGGIGRN